MSNHTSIKKYERKKKCKLQFNVQSVDRKKHPNLKIILMKTCLSQTKDATESKISTD